MPPRPQPVELHSEDEGNREDAGDRASVEEVPAEDVLAEGASEVAEDHAAGWDDVMEVADAAEPAPPAAKKARKYRIPTLFCTCCKASSKDSSASNRIFSS